MIAKIDALLQEYEAKQAAGGIEGFIVHFTKEGLLIRPQPASIEAEVKLGVSEELCQSLQIFFADTNGIASCSSEYLILKSFLNAHKTLERMAGNTVSNRRKKL